MTAAGIPAMAGILHKRARTEKERRLMKELFHLADENRDGVIDYAEHAKHFRRRGLNLTDEEVRRIFDMADKNKDSKVSPDEVSDLEHEIKQKAEVALRAYDRNGDGRVSKHEMEVISGGKLSKDQIQKAFEANDKDGDGYLGPKEMENMIRKRTKVKKRVKK